MQRFFLSLTIEAKTFICNTDVSKKPFRNIIHRKQGKQTIYDWNIDVYVLWRTTINKQEVMTMTKI